MAQPTAHHTAHPAPNPSTSAAANEPAPTNPSAARPVESVPGHDRDADDVPVPAQPIPASALTVADAVFQTLVTGPRPLSVQGRQLGRGLPARLIPLDELKVILLHPATDADARNAVWRHLVTKARAGGPAWVVGAVGVAMPALRRMAARLAVDYPGDTTDLDAQLLAGFLAALRSIPLDGPKVITRLCSPAFHTARRLRNAELAARSGVVTGYAAAAPPAPYGHPDLVLMRAVRAGVISIGEAQLIGATRLEDVTLQAYACAVGTTYAAAVKTRSRAEARLVAALRKGLDDDRAVVAQATLTTVFDPYERAA